MRIGIVSEPPRIGSPIKICLEQAQHLLKLQHSIFLVVQQRNLNLVAGVFGDLLKGLHLIKLKPVPFLSQALDTASKVYRTMAWGENDIDFASMIVDGVVAGHHLSSAGCDRLLCHSTLSPLSISCLYSQSKLKKVLHLHDIPIYFMMKSGGWSKDRPVIESVKRFESWAVNKADGIVCTTRFAARIWRETFGVDSEVIHPGCDPSLTFAFPKKDYVFSLSSWAKGRGAFFLLDMVENLKSSKMKLIIAGSWPDPNEFQRLQESIVKKGLQERVFLFRNLSESAQIELYRGARCFISPPAKGPFLMTSLEAASQGTPIVFPSGASAWEIFTPGVHGVEVTLGDMDSYVEGISRFEEDATVKMLGYAIWKRSKETSWDNHVKKLERILD
jgi:glycosyltransferase involved in cell wall biosynthesis